MKRILLTLCLAIISSTFIKAQRTDCEVTLSVLMADGQNLPASASKNLYNKLHKLIIETGVSEEAGSRFVIASNFIIMDKHILAGPPKSFVYEFEVNLYIGDFLSKKLYNYTTLNLKGVGQTEAKAYNDAMRKINVNSPDLRSFVQVGKEKIVEYYDKNYMQLIKEAQVMASQKNYDQALYSLMSTPTCSKGYDQAMLVAAKIYQQYIDQLCKENLNLAKQVWISNQNEYGANDAAQYLANIYPDASCYKEAQALYKEIDTKMKNDWKFVMKVYNDAVSLEKQRINAWKEVGVAYGRNQPNQTTTINWVK